MVNTVHDHEARFSEVENRFCLLLSFAVFFPPDLQISHALIANDIVQEMAPDRDAAPLWVGVVCRMNETVYMS